MSMLLMAFVCVWAWDAFVNGKLYYCTDGGTMDFIFVGDWVHHPESVAHVVPRSMSEPDEIKAGWSITGLWCLWGAFVGGSVLLSALFAGALWRAASPNKTLHATTAAPGRGSPKGQAYEIGVFGRVAGVGALRRVVPASITSPDSPAPDR